jgi:hypothetical protein
MRYILKSIGVLLLLFIYSRGLAQQSLNGYYLREWLIYSNKYDSTILFDTICQIDHVRLFDKLISIDTLIHAIQNNSITFIENIKVERIFSKECEIQNTKTTFYKFIGIDTLTYIPKIFIFSKKTSIVCEFTPHYLRFLKDQYEIDSLGSMRNTEYYREIIQMIKGDPLFLSERIKTIPTPLPPTY